MDASRARLEKNIARFYLMSFLDGAWLMLPVYMIFFLDHRLDLARIGLLFAACSLTQFLLELPSSAWADKYSRRAVLVVYGLCHMLTDAIYLFADSFGLFLLALILSGVGNALVSGTFSAMIYDTALSLGRAKDYERIQARVNQGEFAGRLLASLLGAGLYLLDSRWLFAAMLLVHLAYALLARALQEPPTEKSISTSFRQVREGIALLGRSSRLWQLVLASSLMVAAADICFVYYQPVFARLGVSVSGLGLLYVGVNLLGFLGAGLYPRIRLSQGKLMGVYLLIDILAALLLGAGSLGPAVLGVALLSLSFGAQNIFIGAVIHQAIPSSHRATALSVQAQINMLFYALLLPPIGWLAEHQGLAWGLWADALLVAAVALLFARARRARLPEEVSA